MLDEQRRTLFVDKKEEPNNDFSFDAYFLKNSLAPEHQVHDLDTNLWYENITVQVCKKEQLTEVLEHKEIKTVILLYYYFDEYNDNDAVLKIIQKGKKPFIALPRIKRNADKKEYLEFLKRNAGYGCGFLVNSTEDFYLLKENNLTDNIRLESGFYTMNSLSRALMKNFGIYKDTVPLELNKKELKKRYNKDSELIIYGHVPVMVSAQCIKKNYDRCTKDYAKLVIKDRRNYEFPVKCDCSSCMNIIFNSLPISLISKKSEISELNVESVRFVFTDEDNLTINNLLSLWIKGSKKENFEFTRGHFTRGAG